MESTVRRLCRAVDSSQQDRYIFALVSGIAFVAFCGMLRGLSALRSLSFNTFSSIKLGDSALWKYRAEGALNLVVAYCGNDKRLLCKILRLRKRQVGSYAARSSCETAFAFAETLRPFIREDFLPRGELVRLRKSFLQELHRHCHLHRPKDRLDTEIDVTGAYGLLLPDLADLPVPRDCDRSNILSCEIKPKSCILPEVSLLRAEHSVKSKVARFTMMQQMKLNKGKISSISLYDPLDLFSNDTRRMRGAIRELLQTPQNNFVLRSIGSNGESLNLTHASNRAATISNTLKVPLEAGESALVDVLVTLLADSQVLADVRQLQALDRFDIENVYWMHAHTSDPRSCSEVRPRR